MKRRRLPPPDGYLTPAEAAHYLGITRQALYLRLQAGTVKGARQVAEVRRRWQIPASSIRDEIAATGGRREAGRPPIYLRPTRTRR